jgi:NAD+ synthase/NAD+ synthase (glutamine-hydrolysing)
MDLLARSSFVQRCEQALHQLAASLKDLPTLVGSVLPNTDPEGRPVYNTAALLADGELQSIHIKTRLPTYDVFDEDRYFEPASHRVPAEVGGLRVGVTICEDIWEGPEQGRHRYKVDPVEDLDAQGIDLLVNLSASPFHAGKGKEREDSLAGLAVRLKKPVLLVNQVGGADSLLFDGRSLGVAPTGKMIARAEAFQEDLVLVDIQKAAGEMRPAAPEGEAELFRAIVMGIRDYMEKCGFRHLVLGLSGGIDSAVCAVLAAEAAGADRVRALAMPSPYSALHSKSDAELLAGNLGVGFEVLPIESVLVAYRELLRPALGDVETTLTEENLQARIRGALIMAFANRHGALALATGNKSELATGYCTLYGDMVGGLAPIGDLLKTQVYRIAEYINRDAEIIPRRIIDRPPSAELRPDQTDQDELPPYDVLDPILERYVGDAESAAAIIKGGIPSDVVEKVIGLVERSEFKRRQSAPVLRVTRRAFGAGRQIPIARGLRGPAS